VPKIIQNGVAPVTVSSGIQVNTIATQNVDGVSFTGHSGVTVEGTGSGQLSLTGVITGSGGITKNSSTFNLVLSGANTYQGTTTVNAGALYVNGTLSGTGNGVTVSGGTLGGTGTISRAVTVNSGGRLEGGTNTTLGTLGVKAATTVNSGGILRAEVSAGGASDKLDMTGGSHTLDLKNGGFVALHANGFTRTTTTTYTLADLDDSAVLRVNGGDVAANTTITTFTSAGANAGTGGDGTGNVNSVGNVDFTLTNFTTTNMQAGDTLTLRRNTAGDLVVIFTPVPEPAAVLLVCGLATAGVAAWRRWKRK
jgi:hypothetical protein